MGFTVLTDWRLTVQYCPGPGMALLLGPLCYACGQGDVRGLTLGRWLVLWSSLCVAVHGYEDGADGYQQLCFGGGGDGVGVGVGVCVLSSAFKVVQGLLTFGLFWVSPWAPLFLSLGCWELEFWELISELVGARRWSF